VGLVGSAEHFKAPTKGAAVTLRPTTSALAVTARLDAAQMSRAMAAVRLGIGAIGMLAPGRLAWRLFLPGKRVDEHVASYTLGNCSWPALASK
jgi:hypothetical protein